MLSYRMITAAAMILGAITSMSPAGAQTPSQVDFERTGGIRGGIGFRFAPMLRFELQAGGLFTAHMRIQSPGFNGRRDLSRVASMQILNNLYLDLAPLFGGMLGAFNPYVMGGVGVSINRVADFRFFEVSFPNSGAWNTSFAWTAGLGVQLDATLVGRWTPLHGFILDIGYQYLDAGRYRWIERNAPFAQGVPGNVSSLPNTAHQVMVSLIIPFDRILGGASWNGASWSGGARAGPLLDPRDHLYGRIGGFVSWTPEDRYRGPFFGGE